MTGEKAGARALEKEIKRVEVLQRDPASVSAVLKTIGTLVIVLDREGRITSFNRACEEKTGYSFAGIEVRRFWDFLLIHDEIESIRAAFEQLRSGQFPNELENHRVAKDGARRLIHWTNGCLTDSYGAVEYVIGTGIDVTAERHAQKDREITIEFLRLVNAGSGLRQLVESAVRLVCETQPDVILMDINLPGMDGIQATKIIHEEMPGISIIGTSVFQEGEHATAMRNAGAINI